MAKLPFPLPELFEIFGQPFGAGHSSAKLPSCGRVDSEDLGPCLPASLRPLLRRLLLCGHRAGGHHSNLLLVGRIQAPGFPAGQRGRGVRSAFAPNHLPRRECFSSSPKPPEPPTWRA